MRRYIAGNTGTHNDADANDRVIERGHVTVLSAAWAKTKWGTPSKNALDYGKPNTLTFDTPEENEKLVAAVKGGKIALFDSSDEAVAAWRKYSGRSEASTWSWDGRTLTDACYTSG